MAETKPEGTDRIVSGSAASATAPQSAPHSDASDLRGRAQAKVAELRGQATDKARDAAEQGLDRASALLDDVARVVGENAERLDELVGKDYGDHVRRAADYVSGAADGLRNKDVDELLDDARDLVRQSPGLAIGLGVIAGFALARVVKSGVDDDGAIGDAGRSNAARPTRIR